MYRPTGNCSASHGPEPCSCNTECALVNTTAGMTAVCRITPRDLVVITDVCPGFPAAARTTLANPDSAIRVPGHIRQKPLIFPDQRRQIAAIVMHQFLHGLDAHGMGRFGRTSLSPHVHATGINLSRPADYLLVHVIQPVAIEPPDQPRRLQRIDSLDRRQWVKGVKNHPRLDLFQFEPVTILVQENITTLAHVHEHGVNLLDQAYVVVGIALEPLWRSEERRVGEEGRSRWAPYH